MQRIESFDILKGIGIILMIVAHTYGPNSIIWGFIYAFHMPLFFIVAGYFFKQNTTTELLRKNYNQLLVQYITICVIVTAITQLRQPHNIQKDIQSSLYGMGPGWFLLAMFMARLEFNIILKLFSNHYLTISLIISICICLIANHYNKSSIFSFFPSLASLFFLSIGFFIKQHNLLNFKYKHSIILVIIGFIFGNIVLSYASNGGVENLIIFKEILIAGIALIAVPRRINFNIDNFVGKEKFLPAGSNRGLDKSKEIAQKLNNVSKAVEDIASTYKEVAATKVDEEDIEEKNKQTFIAELLNNLENMKENILYDFVKDVEGSNVDNIFKILIEKQSITENDLIQILAKENNYLISSEEENSKDKKDLTNMVNAINSAYKIGKLNFIWTNRLKEEKQNIEIQLNGVSKAILNIAEDMQKENESNE